MAGAEAHETHTKQASPILLNGRYELLEPSLAETERSFVFKGRLVPEGAEIAVKILRERFAQDPLFMEKYQAELRSTANLPAHPSLMRYVEIDKMGRRFCVVMELFEGASLLSLVTAPTPIAYPDVLAVMKQLLSLLEMGFREGLMSRNIDLDDVLYRQSDRQMRLVRFRARRSAAASQTKKPSSAAPDLLYLGQTLYELVMGKRYPEGKEVAEIVADRLSDGLKVRYPELTGDELAAISRLFVGLTTRDFSRRLDGYGAAETALAELEKKSLAVQEERRRAAALRAKEEANENFGSAYDTVALLTGKTPRAPRGDEPDASAFRELSRPLEPHDPHAEPGGRFSAANLAIAGCAALLIWFVYWLFYR